MKKLSLFIAAVVGASVASFAQVGTTPGCPGAFGPTKIIDGQTRADLTNTITAGTPGFNNVAAGVVLLDKDTIYILKQIVRVAPGTTLRLEAGTIVMGFPLDTATLHIKPGAKIEALGAATNPVVFTSCKLQGTRNRGDWGGLVITGNATINQPTPATLEGNYGATFGGTNDEDNSGTIQYTRVEYAGFAFAQNQEINGITFGGVGARTIVQFVQVTSAADDSYEWFGGTVNARNLIAWKGLDDDFDTDFGYRGMVQFGIVYRDPEIADFSGSNAFESDNDAAGSALTPKTAPIFSNVEVWGPARTAEAPYNKFFKTGALLRRNTETDIYNSLFFAWPGDTTVTDGQGAEVSGVYINGAAAAANATSGAIRFKKNTVAAYNANPTSRAFDNDATFSAYTWFNTPANANAFTNGLYSFITQKKAPLKEVPLFALNPGAALASGSSFSAGGSTPPLSTDLPLGYVFDANPANRGFANVAYRGAHAGTEWAASWSEYNPNLFKYTAGVPPTREGLNEAFLAGNADAAATGIYCAPNPAANGNTTVNFLMDAETADAAVTVLDMNGSPVFSQAAGIIAGANSVSLSTANLEPGMYIVRVSANGTVAKTTKLNVIR